MKTDTIQICLDVEDDVWNEWCLYHEVPNRTRIHSNTIRIPGTITRQNACFLQNKKMYGLHGFWIETKTLVRHRYYRSQNITVDLFTHRVYVADKMVKINPSDFDLLVHFLKHPHQVLSRDILIDLLEIRKNRVMQDNALSVHIRRIRKAIQNKTLILTVPMVGYMWTSDVTSDK